MEDKKVLVLRDNHSSLACNGTFQDNVVALIPAVHDFESWSNNFCRVHENGKEIFPVFFRDAIAKFRPRRDLENFIHEGFRNGRTKFLLNDGIKDGAT